MPEVPAELALRDVTVTFGGLTALDGVGLALRPRQVHGVIGPNGAGKTTLFNVACGFVRPDHGWVERGGARLDRLHPHRLAGLGVARTLQSLGLFDRMTVLDNVLIGADRHARSGFLGSLLGRSTGDERRLRARAYDALARLGVADTAHRYPPGLPYPLRKRVALARALVAEPDVLLLDEPASGLGADEMSELGDLLVELGRQCAVLLVEHHMDLVMRVCDEITVLDFGRVIAHGRPAEVRDDPAVLAAYLGGEIADAHRP
ncbi:ABC transporter ATP-binding protein [Nocardioides sp. W7]|uniref:ABC transporter ATP-binding protein n=1 Tax=Nocardioides sp. W7 TaxID=2931390 RepID=UPI001FD0B023|nr:ABC transporter ATP-binding protein [Nocardioides sp. W7]